MTLYPSVICAMSLPIDRTTTSRVDATAVSDGRLTNVPSDHMFIAEYSNGEWRKSRIQPYRAIPMAPFALGLHYAQAVFEGMKAYRFDDDRVAVFRVGSHFARFNRSLTRMLMPQVPEQLFEDAIHKLVDLDREWVPKGPDGAYYIRPLVFASEEKMGLKPADEFLFIVVGGPFRPLYTKPLRVKVERTFTRASQGGTGFAKCAGNYAAAMLPTQMAKDEGFDQVIWTDAGNHSRVEESGTMNIAHIDISSGTPTLVTPALTDTILDGITRDSILTIARRDGMNVVEHEVRVEDLRNGLAAGHITELFGIGTAASVAPIGSVSIDGEEFKLNIDGTQHMFTLKKSLDAIRYGQSNDTHEWMSIVDGSAA